MRIWDRDFDEFHGKEDTRFDIMWHRVKGAGAQAHTKVQ